MLFRNHLRGVFSLFLIVFCGMTVIAYNTEAQPSIHIKLEPDVDTIHIGSEIGEVLITALSDRHNALFLWELDGPGKFEGDVTCPGLFYIPPQNIEQDSVKTIISVTVTDEEGKKTTEEVILTLIAEETRSSILTSNPPSQPITKIERLLQAADALFDQRFFTTPENKNAFRLYQQVLSIDPVNYDAREKVHEIAQIYKKWADAAYKKDDYQKAQVYYERCLFVVEYMETDLAELQIEFDAQHIRKRLEEVRKPSSIPKNVIDPVKTLTELKQTLSENLDQYKQLKIKEQQRESVGEQIIPVLKDVVNGLEQIEGIYKQFFPEMIEECKQVRETHSIFKNELLSRQQ